jgi:manganese transport protein
MEENQIAEPQLTRRSFHPWLLYVGPAALTAIGYVDPGNWATDIAGGSRAGYALLSVVLLSGIVAILLQLMSARLGIATGKDLAQLSGQMWPKLAIPAWVAAEMAIIATDLAEVLGAAIALKLLFSIPLAIGIVLTAIDVFFLLAIDRKGSCLIEKIILGLLFIIATSFIYELLLAKPAFSEIFKGYLPTSRLIIDPELLFITIGVIGATVMPHNLYLHSGLILKQLPFISRDKIVKYAKLTTIVSLTGAILLNSALVILAGTVFNQQGQLSVSEIGEAHRLLGPFLGNVAAMIFAIALFASGKSATITGTLAGEMVMSGFLNMRVKPWVRRVVTRSMALVPAVIIIVYFGEQYVTKLMVGSQVFLSLQLPFAMLPLIILTSDKTRMGSLVNGAIMRRVAWLSAYLIILANIILLFVLAKH